MLGGEPADPGGPPGVRVGLVRPGAEPARPGQLRRQVEPDADPRPGAVPVRRRGDLDPQRRALVVDAASGRSTSTNCPLLAAADPDPDRQLVARPAGSSRHAVDQPVQPALAASAAPTTARAPPRRRCPPDRPARTSRACRRGRCRSGPATAPAAARRRAGRTGSAAARSGRRTQRRPSVSGPVRAHADGGRGRLVGRRPRLGGVQCELAAGDDVPGRAPRLCRRPARRGRSARSRRLGRLSSSGGSCDLGRVARPRSPATDRARLATGSPSTSTTAPRSAGAAVDRRVCRLRIAQRRAVQVEARPAR